MIDVKITRAVRPQQIADLMVTAFEGGIGYWASLQSHESATARQEPWYADADIWEEPFSITFCDVEDEHTTWTLDNEKLQAGLQAYADAYPEEFFRSFTDEGYEGDASDADVCLQMILLGKIVYG